MTRISRLSCAAATSVLALALGHNAAMAQSAPAQSEAEQDEDRSVLVVQGYRLSNVAAVEAKRDATGITDSIAQDQAGLLPDLTIAQVAQRIPGLALVPDFGTANDRSPDLAESVMIRGIGSAYNQVTIDGMPLATTSSSSRGARIELLPPSFVSRIDAIKTITANLDPHALSGQLDLITASAFDSNRTSLAVRASIGDNSTAGAADMDQGQNVRADATFSTPFGANRDWGLVVSGSFARYYSSNYDQKPGAVDSSYRIYRTGSNDQVDYADITDTNGYSAASRNQIFVYDDKVTRASGVMKLEYDPSNSTYASIYTGYFYQEEDEIRNEYLATANEKIAPANQTETFGEWAQGRTSLGYSHQPQKRETFVVSGLVDQTLNDALSLELRGSHSRARLNTIRDRSKFSTDKNLPESAFSYDLGAGFPMLDFYDPEFVNDAANYEEGYIQHITQRAAQNLSFGSADLSYNFDRDDRGLGFNAGVSYSNTDQSFDQNRLAGLLDADDPVTMENFVRDVRLPTTDSEVDFLFIDDDAYRAAWQAAGTPITSDDSDTDISSDYDINEQIFAAYVEANFRTDSFNLRAGLRYDNTVNNVDLWLQDDNLPAEPNDAAQYVRSHRRATYDYFLPSVIASYQFGNGFVVRAGYSKTIGRPDFNYYAIGESIGLPEDSEDNTISIKRGNPDLKPRTSNNFDLSLEWYAGRGSLLSVAAFYKDIKDLIFTQNITLDGIVYDGETYTARVTTPMNSQAAKLKGLELSARQDFQDYTDSFLGNFVLSANATFIDGEQTVVQADETLRDVNGLEGQPEFLANATLSYETERFGASVAYNYVGDYLKSINEDAEVFDIFSRHRGEVSAQVRYSVSDNFTVIVEGQNLTKSQIEYYREMPTGQLVAERSQKGRVLWLGVSGRF
ncbi:TonB-dependent receptor [Aurantiacibacter suaedae]|uniref:TonB-dependent receptor n=1 Tax=Aurantiacibacter suaedae TaxID=2545755 RepID=UPI0010FA006D|nr:TonB-dependent receptor [Aurantiacibacter suaedae]